MSRAFSIYLDLLRLGAALMVVFSHWVFFPVFTGTDYASIRSHDLGGDGVVIFFVLSGLLIAFAAEKRKSEGPMLFGADRLSRLWSVALPALVFCYSLDVIGFRIDPAIYAGVGYQGDVSINGLLANATFTNQLWFSNVQPGSNGPYWSLGYEAWYYAIFAAWFFTSGKWRYALTGLLAFLAGPKILLLAPSWVLGLFVWNQIKSGKVEMLGRRNSQLLAIIPVALYAVAHGFGLHTILLDLTTAALGETMMWRLGFSDTFLWALVLGPLVAAHIYGVAGWLGNKDDVPSWVDRSEPAVRWLAGGSFALYLIHFPVMHFSAAILPGEASEIWRQALVFIIPCAVAYVFAEVSERRRPALRNWLRDILDRPDTKPVAKIP
jgi:peptidoglycan/LPS O-acetylase OafA/YrhL